MLIQAGLEPKHKGELWCEVISTATKLDNIMVRPERTKDQKEQNPLIHCSMEKMQNMHKA